MNKETILVSIYINEENAFWISRASKWATESTSVEDSIKSLAEEIYENTKEANPIGNGDSDKLWLSLLINALEKVDWQKIAKKYIESLSLSSVGQSGTDPLAAPLPPPDHLISD